MEAAADVEWELELEELEEPEADGEALVDPVEMVAEAPAGKSGLPADEGVALPMKC